MNSGLSESEEIPMWNPSKCPVCTGRAVLWCSNCCKVGYCSGTHQLEDRQKHMATCYPLRIIYNKEFGRCVVATRDIRMGEELLQETPLMVAPNMSMNTQACLGCYQRVKPVPIMGWIYKCTTCHWPVCDKFCQESDHHKKMECPILANKNILPEHVPTKHRSHLIMTLRLLILKDKFEDISEKITHLTTSRTYDLKLTENEGMPASTDQSLPAAAIRFIRAKCGMSFSSELIIYMAHVVANNSIQNDEHASEFLLFRFASFLFYYGSLITHDCMPNSRWVIHQEDTGFLGKFSAVQDIQEGEVITRSYIPIWPFLPTTHRQSFLISGWYFICKCKRCSDPTEMGTFLSAVKCTSFRHYEDPSGPQPGCFIPPNPETAAINRGIVRCTHCENTYSFPKLMTNIVGPLDREFQEIRDSIHEPTTGTYEDLLSKIGRLEKFKELASVRLNANHYILVNCDYEILQCLYLVIKDVAFAQTDDNQYHAGIADKMIKSADRCLHIADKICPGISSFRGIVLFYKQHAMCSLLAKNLKLFVNQIAILQFQDIQNFVHYIKQEIQKTEAVRKSAREILQKSCIGSFENNMALMLAPTLDDILSYNYILSAFLGYDARAILDDDYEDRTGNYNNEGGNANGDTIEDLLEIIEAETGIRFENGIPINRNPGSSSSSREMELHFRGDPNDGNPGRYGAGPEALRSFVAPDAQNNSSYWDHNYAFPGQT